MKKLTLPILLALLISVVAVHPADSVGHWWSRYSKLGIHSIRPDSTVQFVQSAVDGGAHFTVVKAVDDLSYLSTVKEISPETVTVARLTHAEEGAHLVIDPDTNLEWYAGVIMDVIFNKIEEEPELADAVDYWEPINEPLGGGVPSDVFERLAQLMIICMDRAEARGLHLALFSFAAGVPEWADMQAMVETDVFERAKTGGHILALHEGVPNPEWPVDQWYGPGNTIPGAPEIPNTGALCGRYRYWYYLLEQRDEVVPLFISEFYAGGGYGGDADIEDIVARMMWYDGLLRSDDYALGFAPFTLGPTSGWVKQDYGFAYPSLVEYVIYAATREYHFVFLPLARREPGEAREHLFVFPFNRRFISQSFLPIVHNAWSLATPDTKRAPRVMEGRR